MSALTQRLCQGVFYLLMARCQGDDEMSDENNQGNSSNQQGDPNGQTGSQPLQFDAWLEQQGDDVKGLLNTHASGLKTALSAERDRNKELEKSLRDAASKAEKGSESEKRLSELANQVTESNRKSAFYEGAATAGVNNLKLAYMAATTDDLFKRDGSVDFEAMRRTYPELFGGKSSQSNNGGSGTNSQPNAKPNMDDYIRGQLR